ncbi:tetratricopeptide repeat protein 27 [Zerene cesonia]|uniref:tetratricopeptide repeat protein 27 n=1 Tax=Zerene cesonia TaxID=33412 RepID=UPI0018E4F86B|nr:tetratricopeptide repeat protein 27 [Zerene cesonia]
MSLEKNEILFLCNFDSEFSDSEPVLLKNLWSGQWCVDNLNLCKELLSNLENDEMQKLLKQYKADESSLQAVQQMAIGAFLTFCDKNWNPHPKELNLEEFFKTEWPKNIDVSTLLQSDSEPIYNNIVYPELLYFSIQIFSALCHIDSNMLHNWWLLRSQVVHQRVLEDNSAKLFNNIDLIAAKLCNFSLRYTDRNLLILLNLELAQAYLVYDRVQKVESYLQKAKELAGLKLELTGILGKRTKFQQKALPQLALTSELDSKIERTPAEETHGKSELPPDVELQDDVRLNKIAFDEKISEADLPSLEQTLCLLTAQYLLKSQPKDDLLHEELRPYIDAVNNQKSGPWSTRVAALLFRCKLEANHKRTVERAMLQCETIVNDKTGVSSTNRLSYLWASGLSPAWTWRQQLADLYLSLGLVKAALEEYLKLELWEDVIVCYTMLQLRHKAAEVIQQQIDVKPTVKLYCLLGDATDDVNCYQKAWEFSQCKSSRAQRHWGNYLFDHKRYEECLPHFEKSVEINPIQEHVWLRIGFAALSIENWELSAKAYRRYTYLHPNSFEAWNNLAKVYVKQGDKHRAYRALMEALKLNYDNWKLWENVVVVSVATGHFDDVIRGIHRILDLQNKFDDVEVLALLVNAIVTADDDDEDSAARLRKRVLELFGRITSIHPNKAEIWRLYSDVSPTYLLKAQRLLRTYRCVTQNGNWTNDPDTCKRVIALTRELLEYSVKARQEAVDKEILQADQQLSSARLTGQAVIRVIERQIWPDSDLEDLREEFRNATEYMKTIMYIVS